MRITTLDDVGKRSKGWRPEEWLAAVGRHPQTLLSSSLLKWMTRKSTARRHLFIHLAFPDVVHAICPRLGHLIQDCRLEEGHIGRMHVG